MSDNSSIEWCDASWNPTRGCNKVSPGCKHCYAETFAERFRGVPGHPYEQGFDFRLAPQKLDAPLHWKKPRRIFVNSMSDLFHKDVPDEYIAAVFGVMAASPQHTFQVLTKRAERLPKWNAWVADNGGLAKYIRSQTVRSSPPSVVASYFYSLVRTEIDRYGNRNRTADDPWCSVLNAAGCMAWPLPNVWLGVSVENQKYADERIPSLCRVPAAVRFISAEPLLGPVDIAPWLTNRRPCRHFEAFTPEAKAAYPVAPTEIVRRGIDWVIAGGESGNGARPCAVEWIESVAAQCQAAKVPIFVKQLGGNVVSTGRTGPVDAVLGSKAARPDDLAPNGEAWAWRAGLAHPKGGDPSEWPEHLRVREFPR